MIQFTEFFEGILSSSGLDADLKRALVTSSQSREEEILAQFTYGIDASDLKGLTIIDSI